MSEHLHCPVCGRSDDKQAREVLTACGIALDQRTGLLRHGEQAKCLTPNQTRMMAALMLASPRRLSTDRLIDVLYGNDIDGGPLGPVTVIRTMIHRLRRAIAAIGAPAVISTRFGARGYWLEPVPVVPPQPSPQLPLRQLCTEPA